MRHRQWQQTPSFFFLIKLFIQSIHAVTMHAIYELKIDNNAQTQNNKINEIFNIERSLMGYFFFGHVIGKTSA